METVEMGPAEVERRETCPECGTLALPGGEKTDLEGNLLAEFYECGNPDCDCVWWIGVKD
ncbi:hypothetical protein [Natronoarchaeum rubrum]|uniref:hypothetical protein n=1 Tax=Natronoarchaeum rubrum TaxID=755311 RepID=UPI0021119930|nr:hypothetical protein [Natronoarchaeum rubrum]